MDNNTMIVLILLIVCLTMIITMIVSLSFYNIKQEKKAEEINEPQVINMDINVVNKVSKLPRPYRRKFRDK